MERLRDMGVGLLIQLLIFGWLYACSDRQEQEINPSQAKQEKYTTEKVVIVVIDGPRYSDTWGMAARPHIPVMAAALAPQGTFFTNFQNEGPTYTLAGHTALTTGFYQAIANDGQEYPARPSVFQQYLAQHRQAPDKAIILGGKPKLKVLADTRHLDWRSRFNPLVDCGDEGQLRPDSLTLQTALEMLRVKQPNLLLIQFSGPDVNGHANNWQGYLNSLQETDRLVGELWQWLQEEEYYQAKTALFVTNDHGRHGQGHKDGFVSHGDNCVDCRHISLLALGPDFPANRVVKEPYEQIDIPVTIGKLLGIRLIEQEGKPILPLFGAVK